MNLAITPMGENPQSAPKDASRAEVAVSGEPKGWLISEVWSDSREVTKAIVIDSLAFVFVLVALLLGYGGLQVLQHFGYPKDRLERFEAIHYWGYLSCHTMFVIDLLWKLLLALFVRGRKK